MNDTTKPAIGGECVTAGLFLRSFDGKMIQIVGLFPVTDAGDANDYMAANPGTGVLTIVNGIALIAANSDAGTLPEKMQKAMDPHVVVRLPITPAFVDSVLCTMIESADFGWFEWSDITQGPGNEITPDIPSYVAARCTEYDPDTGTQPEGGAEGVLVDGARIAAAIGRLLSEDLVRDDIRGALAEAVGTNDAGHVDVEIADCIAQIAVLGEIRYG